MSQYDQVLNICLCCKKTIKTNQSIIFCQSDRCYWHKSCLKQKLENEYEAKLMAGYKYGSEQSYKRMHCSCGSSLKKKDRLSKKIKKTIKTISFPLAILLLAL